MSRGSRRRVLKGLGLVLPAAWARPVVEAVVLPAHAQTSIPGSSTPGTCGAPEGCKVVLASSFPWPGGVGPFTVPFYDTPDCGGDLEMVEIVVAGSEAEAEAVLGCAVVPLPATPSPASGCNFFICGIA